MTRYRFYFHYRKCDKKMSVHFRNVCHVVDEVHCHAACHTKRNKRQPYLVMQGFSHFVDVVRLHAGKTLAIIQDDAPPITGLG